MRIEFPTLYTLWYLEVVNEAFSCLIDLPRTTTNLVVSMVLRKLLLLPPFQKDRLKVATTVSLA